MIALLALIAAVPELFQAYAPDSLVIFRVPFLKFNTVEGRFRSFAAAVSYEEDLARSSAIARIDARSLDSGFEQRDLDLKGPAFFEVEKFPEISFRSTRVEKSGAGFRLVGDLTMRGVTRPIALDLSLTGLLRDDPQVQRIGFLARGKLSRKDFGIGTGPAAATIADEVEIEIRISGQRQVWAVVPEQYPGDAGKKNAAFPAAAAWAKSGPEAGLAKLRELRGAAGYDGSADQYLLLGTHLATRGDPGGAARVFEDCQREFPRELRCPVRLAQVWQAAGDSGRAREAARGALRIDPNSVAAQEMLRRLE
jgi:polyisoprenoid-binding protein YceI